MIGLRDAGAVVVGSGLAGLAAALELARSMPITLLTKTAGLAGGSSPLAQGGVAAALGPGDDPGRHAADTVAAGAGLVDPSAALLLAREGAAHLRRLIGLGLPFDRDAAGGVLFGREAAHGRARILHAGGDATGRMLVDAFAARIRAQPNIRVEEEAFAVELVVRDGVARGLLAHHRRAGWVLHRCPRILLATGGIGAAYARTTNPREATGDGLALAARAGALLSDLEFVQFHPTALDVAGEGGRMPLLTEALRGAGAVLVDDRGRRFMAEVHPDAELAPRDVVARAVWRRRVAGGTVLLDMRAVLADRPGSFPTVRAICRHAGLDPEREPVPVAPAAHYHMGGVATDDRGRSSIAGLWACGEVASTGVHGANRLASNSLLEALVFGTRAAADAAGWAAPAAAPLGLPDLPAVPGAAAAGKVSALAALAGGTLYEGAGLARDAAGLSQAVASLSGAAAALDRLEAGPAPGFDAVRRWGEARNLLLAGRLVARSALDREESRGAHFRTDFPSSLPKPARRFASARDLLGPVAPARDLLGPVAPARDLLGPVAPADRQEILACSTP